MNRRKPCPPPLVILHVILNTTWLLGRYIERKVGEGERKKKVERLFVSIACTLAGVT